jgi:hypothetical protein
VFADIRFTKSTWLKSVIINSTISGVGDFYTKWGQRATKWIHSHSALVEQLRQNYRNALIAKAAAASDAAAASHAAAASVSAASTSAAAANPSSNVIAGTSAVPNAGTTSSIGPSAVSSTPNAPVASPGGTPLVGDLGADKTAALMADSVAAGADASQSDLVDNNGDETISSESTSSAATDASTRIPAMMWANRDIIWKVMVCLIMLWFGSAISSGINRIDHRLMAIESHQQLFTSSSSSRYVCSDPRSVAGDVPCSRGARIAELDARFAQLLRDMEATQPPQSESSAAESDLQLLERWRAQLSPNF